MGDLGIETAVEHVGEGRYRATLDEAWEIWGPMGGYIASVALRAIGAASPTTTPASFSCLYLGVAAFDAVDIEVTTVKAGRTVAFHQALVTQGGRPMLTASVCSIGEAASTGPQILEHVDGDAPDVADPESLKTPAELMADRDDPGPPFPFWNNFDQRVIGFHEEWPPTEPLEPTWLSWCRFVPTATFADPWVDACRAVVMVDVQSWPAAHRPHAYKQLPVYAPSLDLYVAFHQPPGTWGDWLRADGHSAVAEGGLMGWTGRLWGRDRRLLASGGGQLLCRAAAAQA